MEQTRISEKCFGCERFGKLKKVMLHRPGSELRLINKDNYKRWLFDRVPDEAGYAREHDRYRELLEQCGVEVLRLSDYVGQTAPMIDSMPNLTFLHDVAVVSSKGAILSHMAWQARAKEHEVVREALESLGVPILVDFDREKKAFEGCLLLSDQTVLVAETERHSRAAVCKFIRKMLRHFEEVIHVDVPKQRRYMHPDTIFSRVSENLALAYLPVFEETLLFTRGGIERLDFVDFMAKRGVELLPICDAEQRRLGCTFVSLEPGVMLHYDTALNKQTLSRLRRKGVEVILFHPEAMTAGGGSLRCHTLRLYRDCK